jgi:hypothetical protein
MADDGKENDLLCGRKRAMRSLIPAKDLGGFLEEGVIEVTVVVDADALENGVLTRGLLEDEVMVVDGFLREERVGGGGKMTGEDLRGSCERVESGTGLRCGNA